MFEGLGHGVFLQHAALLQLVVDAVGHGQSQMVDEQAALEGFVGVHAGGGAAEFDLVGVDELFDILTQFVEFVEGLGGEIHLVGADGEGAAEELLLLDGGKFRAGFATDVAGVVGKFGVAEGFVKIEDVAVGVVLAEGLGPPPDDAVRPTSAVFRRMFPFLYSPQRGGI